MRLVEQVEKESIKKVSLILVREVIELIDM